MCYQCGELLHRSTHLSVSDGIVIWILAMLPISAFFTLGGIVGVLASIGLLSILVPMRFWEGFRYVLVAREPIALPPARAVIEPPERGPDPQSGGG